jgi:phosphatidylinositol glycan class V
MQLLSKGAARVLLVAAAIRLTYTAVALALSSAFPDYDTSGSLLSSNCSSAWPSNVTADTQPEPFVVWDSVFFHRIAACGYEYEQFYAFFPGLPGKPFQPQHFLTGCCCCSLSKPLVAGLVRGLRKTGKDRRF